MDSVPDVAIAAAEDAVNADAAAGSGEAALKDSAPPVELFDNKHAQVYPSYTKKEVEVVHESCSERKHPTCIKWAKAGECNKRHVARKCRKSCDQCPKPFKESCSERKHPTCIKWAKAGECNKRHVARKCRKSCDQCPKPFKESCSERKHPTCIKWAKAGECNKRHVARKCRKSCDQCPKPFKESCSERKHPTCIKWAKAGECNKRHVARKCRKSCDQCPKPFKESCSERKHPTCIKWAKAGECNRRHVARKCRKSCDQCPKPFKESCSERKHPTCIKWAKASECNRRHVARKCRKSCDQCPKPFKESCPKRKHPTCIKWAKAGECNKRHVARKCRKSCDQCPKPFKESCSKSRHPTCTKWAKAGECNKRHVARKCQKSCDQCPKPFKESCSERKHPTCIKWAKAGECKKRHVARKCRKSCDQCPKPFKEKDTLLVQNGPRLVNVPKAMWQESAEDHVTNVQNHSKKDVQAEEGLSNARNGQKKENAKAALLERSVQDHVVDANEIVQTEVRSVENGPKTVNVIRDMYPESAENPATAAVESSHCFGSNTKTFNNRRNSEKGIQGYWANVEDVKDRYNSMDDMEGGGIQYVAQHNQDVIQSRRGGLKVWMAAILIAGEMVGGGILSLPKAIDQSGILGFCMVLMFGAAACYAGTVLGKCWLILTERWPEFKEHTRDPYPSIADKAFGRVFKYITKFSVDVTLFGASTVFLLLGSQLTQSLAFSSASHVDVSYCYWVLIFGACLAPIMWLGTPKDFWPIGILALGSTALTVILAVIAMIMHKYKHLEDYKDLEHSEVTTKGTFLAFGTILFMYGGAATFPTIQNDMKDTKQFVSSVLVGFTESQNLRKGYPDIAKQHYRPDVYIVMQVYHFTGNCHPTLVRIVKWVLTRVEAILSLYLPIAFTSYFVFGNTIKPNLLASFDSGGLRQACEGLIIVHLLMAFFVAINPLCQDMEKILNIPNRFGIKRMIFRTSLMMCIVFVAESIPHFLYILNLIGGSTVTLMTFVFPCLFYLKLTSMKSPSPENPWPKWDVPLWEKIMLIEIMIVGIVGGSISTYVAFTKIISPASFILPCYVDINAAS
ncbi:Amino acid transporter AVT1D [Nymphon striatum]|nr:Amino acid transporter AVT1D [Nymphon striatum]